MIEIEQFQDRLRAVRGHFGLSQTEMTQRFRLGTGGWQRLEKEGRAPKDEVLVELSNAGIDLNWLLTGEGQMRRDAGPVAKEAPSVDEGLLETCIEALEEELARAGRTLPPAKKAKAVSALYELLSDEEGEERRPNVKVVQQFIKLAG